MEVKQSSAELNSALALQLWPAARPPGQHFQSPRQPRSTQMHWRWGMLSMILNVDNKQGLPSAGKSRGYPKSFINTHTHTHRHSLKPMRKIHFQSGKCLFCVAVPRQSPFLLIPDEKRCSCSSSIGGVYKTGKEEQLLHTPCVIPIQLAQGTAFFFML